MKSMAKFSYHYGLKVRIYPSSNQRKLINLNSDIARTVHNKLLAIDKELYQLKQVKLPLDTVLQRITQLKQRKNHKYLVNHYSYMQANGIDSLAIANAKQNYQTAWKLFKQVHTAGTPKFHKKSYRESYQTNAQYRKDAAMDVFSSSGVKFLDLNHIQLPKLGKIRIKGSHKRLLLRKSDIRIGTVTISKSVDDKYFVSMQLASDTPFVTPKPVTNSRIGIDLNVDNFLTTSDGSVIVNPRYYRRLKLKLAREQRKLSRKRVRALKEKRNLQIAKNYQHQRLVVAKLQAKVRRRRNNFLHVVSTALINNHDLVVAENLRSKNLLKNHALAMSIADIGWRLFLNMLEYKANLYGRMFISVDPKNNTQTCSACEFVMSTNGTNKLTLADREWTCPNCGKFHIRDWNVAKNILRKGLQQIA